MEPKNSAQIENSKIQLIGNELVEEIFAFVDSAKKILGNDVVKEEIAKIRKDYEDIIAKKNESEVAKEKNHADELAKLRQEYEDKLDKQLEEQIQKDNEIGQRMRLEKKQKALDQKALAAADKEPQKNLPETSSIPIPSDATKFSIRQSLPIFTDLVPPVGPTLPDDFLDLSHYQTVKEDDEIVKESTGSTGNKIGSPQQLLQAGTTNEFKPKSPMKRKYPDEDETKEENK